MSDPNRESIVLGRITSTFGIKGWVKVYSYTDPITGIFDYDQWYLSRNGQIQPLEVEAGKPHGKGLIAKLKGFDTPEHAQTLAGMDILIDKQQLPDLDDGEYYWHQLKGLQVINLQQVCLGRVDYLFETGANDVMVVKPSVESLDDRERLLPYLPEQVILDIDLTHDRITVDWDASF